MIFISEAAMVPTPRLALVILVGTLAYFGLAVLGWGRRPSVSEVVSDAY